MKFLLSELTPPSVILHSLVISHKFGNLILTVNLACIIIYKYNNAQLEEIQRIKTRHILAICKIKLDPFNNDIVIYLDKDFSIWMLYFDIELKSTRILIGQISSKGKRISTEGPPCIIPQRYDNPDYIVLYIFDGVFTVFNFNQGYDRIELLEQKETRKRKNETGLWTSWSGKLGSIIVQSIIPLTSPDNSIAVLYRDINSAYSMRYIQLQDNNSTIIKQFSEFDQIPSAIIPMEIGGHLAFDSNVYYFPPPNVRITVPATLDTVIVSDKMNYLIKSTDLESERIVSFSVIDAKRVLLATTTGVFYVLFVEMQFLSSTILVANDMQLINLGQVINGHPNGVHQISENKFLVTSRTSKSAVFSIIGEQPHVKIKSIVEGGSPIIDMFTSVNGNTEIYTCQGSLNGSEIRNYSTVMTNLVLIRSQLLDSQVWSSRVIGNQLEINRQISLEIDSLNENTTSRSNLIDYYEDGETTISITKCKITKNGTDIYKGKFAYAKISHNIIVVETEDNNLHILQEKYPVIIIPARGKVISTDIGMISQSEFIIMASTSYTFELWRIKGAKKQVVFEEETNEMFSSSVVVHEDGVVSIILSLEDGTVNHIHFPLNNPREITRSVIQINTDERCSIAKYGTEVILYTSNSIFTLKRNIISKQYHNYSHKIRRIIDVKFISQHKILVVCRNKVLLFQYNTKPSIKSLPYKSIEFEEMCFKCLDIPDSPYFLTLSRDINETNLINVVEKSSLKVVMDHESEFEIKDGCILPLDDPFESDADWFITLSDSSKPVSIFRIFDKKIDLVKELQISNYTSEKLYFDSIILVDPEELTYLLYGQVPLLVQIELDSNDPYKIVWKVNAITVYNTPAYAVGAVVTDARIFIGDVIRGVYEPDNSSNSLVKLPMTHQYLSCMEVINFKCLNCLICGDALGNISIMDLSKNEIVCQFNIGDQINVVKVVNSSVVIGTVSGAIYLLSESEMEDLDILKKITMELKSFTSTSINEWKVLGRDNEELDDTLLPFDERLANEFLGRLTYMETKEDQYLQAFKFKYKQSYKHKQFLQQIHHKCHSL